MNLDMQTINELAKRFECLPLTEMDYAQLIMYGRLLVISDDRKKITTYWYRGSEFALEDERCLTLTCRFEGDGNRGFEVAVNNKNDKVFGPDYSANLKPYATNMAVAEHYQSESFRQHRAELLAQRQQKG